MGFGQIQFGGLASGLDTNAIISALMQVEALPIAKLEAQKEEAEKKIDLLGTFEGLLKKLEEQASALGSADSFSSYSVSSAIESLATASVTGAATPGSHVIEVLSTAAADRFAFDGIADSQAALSAGTVSFDYDGTSYSITVNAGDTLDQVAKAIEDAAGDDVTASVVNTGATGSPNYQLVIGGKETGAAYQIDNLSSSVAELVNPTELVNASNAQIKLDALTIERSTNAFDDVLEGISIDVLAAEVGTQFAITVELDKEAIKEKITAMVDAYNDVIGFINSQNEYTTVDGEDGGETGGPLFGDSLLTTVQSAIHGALHDVDLATVLADTTGYSTLGLLGISVGVDGTLDVDDEKLDAKMSEDFESFMDLFVDSDGFDNGGLALGDPAYYVDTTEDTGLADDLARIIDQLLSDKVSATGIDLPGLIDSRKETLKENIELYDKRIEDLERHLEDYEELLVHKFSALEQLMAGLNAQSSYLASALGAQPQN